MIILFVYRKFEKDTHCMLWPLRFMITRKKNYILYTIQLKFEHCITIMDLCMQQEKYPSIQSKSHFNANSNAT